MKGLALSYHHLRQGCLAKSGHAILPGDGRIAGTGALSLPVSACMNGAAL